jgi:hypothetical protein
MIANAENRENFRDTGLFPIFERVCRKAYQVLKCRNILGKPGVNRNRSPIVGKIAVLPPIRDNRPTACRG